MKNLALILLAVALVSFACAKTITTTEADVRSGSDKEENQGDQLKAMDELAQNDTSDEKDTVRFSDGQLVLLRHIDCNNSRTIIISLHEHRDYMSRY